jgi:hypothetical protein
MIAQSIQPGDRVKFAARFLRSIACHTGPTCFATGTVESVRQYGGRSGVAIATVAWDDPDEGSAVNVANLVRVDDMHLECIQ